MSHVLACGWWSTRGSIHGAQSHEVKAEISECAVIKHAACAMCCMILQQDM